jgi:predicted RNA binding protein YcfA (HicA-like mRNA interferase family)
MSRKEKLIRKLKQKPKDFSWDELTSLLKAFGYEQAKPGKTGGSRRRFIHPTAHPIILHKPHPGKFLKMYIIDDIIETLEREGMV